MQSKPPPPELDGEDKHARHPGINGALLYNGFGEGGCIVLKDFKLAVKKEGGKR